MLNTINHTNKSSKLVYQGKYLEVYLTDRDADGSQLDSWFVDVLYANSDVGLTFFQAATASKKDEAVARAESFIRGYDYARDEFVEWAKQPRL